MWYDAEHDMWFEGEMPLDVRGRCAVALGGVACERPMSVEVSDNISELELMAQGVEALARRVVGPYPSPRGADKNPAPDRGYLGTINERLRDVRAVLDAALSELSRASRPMCPRTVGSTGSRTVTYRPQVQVLPASVERKPRFSFGVITGHRSPGISNE